MGSPAFEHRPAFLDKGPARLQMVFRRCRARLMERFHFEHRGQRLGLCREEVALHIAVGDARSVGDAAGEGGGFTLQRFILDDAVKQT